MAYYYFESIYRIESCSSPWVFSLLYIPIYSSIRWTEHNVPNLVKKRKKTQDAQWQAQKGSDIGCSMHFPLRKPCQLQGGEHQLWPVPGEKGGRFLAPSFPSLQAPVQNWSQSSPRDRITLESQIQASLCQIWSGRGFQLQIPGFESTITVLVQI